MHRNTIGEWLRRYREGGLEGLLEVGPSGAPIGARHIPTSVLVDLKARLQERDGFAHYAEVQQWLEEEFGLQIPYGTVYRTVRERLKAKLKRPRPRHEKKDETAEAPASRPRSTKRWQGATPAMAAGLTDHVWGLRELLLFRVPPWQQPALE